MEATSLLTSLPSAPPDWCELSPHAERSFRIQWCSDAWMEREAFALRRQVFCIEQGLFGADDLDEIDRAEDSVRHLVATSCLAGEADEVVGTVRIHLAAPGLWWGSRLAVRRDWRRHLQLGTSLIRLAVSSAHALGCEEFLAHVQAQNVPLFKRLHWSVMEMRELHGKPHAWMRADLAHYPPCLTPLAGYVLSEGSPS